MVNPRKAHPIDPGLIPLFDRSGRANLGHALETAVRIELERRRMEVRYVRNEDLSELDFLARPAQGQPYLIQLCADLAGEATRAREVRGLVAAAEDFPEAVPLLITLAPESAGETPEPIDVVDAALWLLGR